MGNQGRALAHHAMIIVCMLSAVLGLCKAQGQWEFVGLRPTAEAYRVAAIDSSTCFLMNEDAYHTFPGCPLFVTRDAAKSWEKLSDSTISIDAVDPELLTVLQTGSIGVEKFFRVVQSRDTGRSWEKLSAFPLDALPEDLRNDRYSVHSWTHDRAFLYTGGFLITMKRGDTLPSLMSLPFNPNFCLRTDSVLWIYSPKQVGRSESGGDTWEMVFEDNAIRRFAAQDPRKAWVYTRDHSLQTTGDGGKTWAEVPFPRITRFYDKLHMYPFVYCYPPVKPAQRLWFGNSHEFYVLNDDSTWDLLVKPSMAYSRNHFISRCRDGSSWTTGNDSDSSADLSVYRAIKEPAYTQSLTVKDLSSYGVKRANLILPYIGWQSWNEGVIERAEGAGAFQLIGTIRSPDFVYTDESCPSKGPYRYRVSLNPPPGKYGRLEFGPIILDRDSVLIIDLLEYLVTPAGKTLQYHNGLLSFCTYDSSQYMYTYHREYADRDTADASLSIVQHPDLLLHEDRLTHHYGIFDKAIDHVNGWKTSAGQRFIVTAVPPDKVPDTLQILTPGGNGMEKVDAKILLVRDVGIAEMRLDWEISPPSNMGGTYFITLDDILDIREIPRVATDIRIQSVFPNPASGVVNIGIEIRGSLIATLDLYDTFGRKVASLADRGMSKGRHVFQRSFGDLPRGMYFVVLRQGESLQSKKLLLW